MLAEGVGMLDAVRIRDLHCAGFDVRLQFNPKRIVSSGAKVDAASIKVRKCFLCVEHLPEAQQGILYRENFLILCNPMPIFRQHFTISHVRHIPQAVEEFILEFLSFGKDLSPHFTVFYNGPKCGASAPDHMHFQASPAGTIPVEIDARNPERRVLRKKLAGVDIYLLKQYGREVIVLEGKIEQEMEQVFLRITTAMRKVMNTLEEPLMNVLCSYAEGSWRIIVFPRTKHRPDVYFREGDDKILVSPAAVDIGGLVITPVEKDFVSVSEKLMEQIFREVSVAPETLDAIIDKM